ncbi:N-acetylmuramic acid 6-phosphate etherase, partial [Vibrio parahaemolyticus AQ3810]
ATAKLPS